jgi:hypothetical protein
MMLYAAGPYHDLSIEAAAPCGLTWTGSLLWLADSGHERAIGVDPHSGEQLAVVPCPGLRSGLATSDGHLVYVAGADSELCTVEISSGKVVERAANPRRGREISGLEGGRLGLWIGHGEVLDWRTPPDLRLVDSIGVSNPVTGITLTDRYVVYCTHPTRPMRVPLGTIVVVDPTAREEVLSINVHGTPTGLAWDGSRIWYCDYSSSRLRAIDVPGIVR